jgi:hypothetical protein
VVVVEDDELLPPEHAARAKAATAAVSTMGTDFCIPSFLSVNRMAGYYSVRLRVPPLAP